MHISVDLTFTKVCIEVFITISFLSFFSFKHYVNEEDNDYLFSKKSSEGKSRKKIEA